MKRELEEFWKRLPDIINNNNNNNMQTLANPDQLG
jgi:hypothetical protein